MTKLEEPSDFQTIRKLPYASRYRKERRKSADSMFRFHKTLDVVTLFHRPSVASSVRVQTLLKQLSAQATETATADQAGDHTEQTKLQRTDFELNITEEVPTGDQLKSILEYIGVSRINRLVEGAKDGNDALAKVKADPKKFRFPVTVDWNNGRAVIGDDEQEITNMISKQS